MPHLASNLSAAIVRSPSDVSLRNGKSKEATFSCQASIKQKEVLGFRTHVNGTSLDRLAKDRTHCSVDRNTATLTCNETVENSIQRHVLSCDFIEPYLVSCDFTITGLAEADSNVVECFLTNGTSDVDNKSAGLFIIRKYMYTFFTNTQSTLDLCMCDPHILVIIYIFTLLSLMGSCSC